MQVGPVPGNNVLGGDSPTQLPSATGSGTAVGEFRELLLLAN